TVLGVEQEDQPQQHRQEAGINLVRVVVENLAEQLALAVVVGGLEAAQQLEESGQYLSGQARRDSVLILAAGSKASGQTLLLRQREQPLGAQQHVQGGKDGPAGYLGHRLHGEGQLSR